MEQEMGETEIASQMYKFIDQAYTWALDGMKYVALLNLEECLSVNACYQILERFDNYMKEHPPLSEVNFFEMLDLAGRCENVTLLKQCKCAQRKCRETSQLFIKRRELIEKIKLKIETTSKRKATKCKLNVSERPSESLSMTSEPESRPVSENTKLNDCKTESSNSDFSCIDNLSTLSTQTSSSDDQNRDNVHSPVSSENKELSTVGNYSNTCQKPARKVLKKSASMSSHQLARALSHVHSHSGVTLTIGSPVCIQEEMDTTGKSKLVLIIEELISTEQEYVKSLNYVVENYFPEMKRLDIPQSLLCKGNVIFGNIEKIAEFHTGYFLEDLKNCEGKPSLVAKAFQANRENFGLYALYSKNKPQSDQLLQEHGNEFFKTKQMELEDKMDLASYLLKPVQRMGKYALLLHAMSKTAARSDERSLKEAEELVKFQLRHGNDLLTMDSIQDCDVNLKEQGNLLRQEQFIMFSGRRKIVRRVFLFEDLILFSKPLYVHGGHDVYQYKRSYKTAEMGMTENIGESGFKFEVWFRRRRSQATQDRFILQSTTRVIRRAWVEEIRSLLWKQALRNKDHRKIEMSSMGVGNKPHLDLTLSSENRITDRAIANSPTRDPHILADRLAYCRSRSSIAVSTFDHATHLSKRPLSAISTSSSTSSVVSENNPPISYFSSATLPSWPTKSCSSSSSSSSSSSLVPPMAYFHFHAIPENLNEDSERTCELSSASSECTPQNHLLDVSSTAASVTRQYVTTISI